MYDVLSIAEDLRQGAVTSEALTETLLARIGEKDGEGARTFTEVFDEAALAEARASDSRRQNSAPLSPLDGVAISVKDLFDLEGKLTRAGSVARHAAPLASSDATIVSRLRQAGAVIIGRTNMTEFAFSGVGLNPHYGTPRCHWDRATGRIPGGSSSGAAISVSDGFAVAAIGTDTGGSVRIPAALNGLVGFKPTQARVPRHGVFPLAPSLDTVGPLASSVSGCAVVAAVLAGTEITLPRRFDLKGLRLAVPETVVWDQADAQVTAAMTRAIAALVDAGVEVTRLALPVFEQILDANKDGGIVVYEAYQLHRQMLEAGGLDYDPRVRVRIERGARLSAGDYAQFCATRPRLMTAFDEWLKPYDALLAPTVPLVAPALTALASDDGYFRANALMLRNTALLNYLDIPALSLPCHAGNEAPVGLMLGGRRGQDDRLMDMAAAIEAVVTTKS